jgi:hypothetical protein
MNNSAQGYSYAPNYLSGNYPQPPPAPNYFAPPSPYSQVPNQQPYPVIVNNVPQPMIIMMPKSVGTAIVLAFFFGPLGMLYSTVVGGLVMLLVNIVIVLPTLGFGLLITWPICIIWAAMAASTHNSKIYGYVQGR